MPGMNPWLGVLQSRNEEHRERNGPGLGIGKIEVGMADGTCRHFHIAAKYGGSRRRQSAGLMALVPCSGN